MGATSCTGVTCYHDHSECHVVDATTYRCSCETGWEMKNWWSEGNVTREERCVSTATPAVTYILTGLLSFICLGCCFMGFKMCTGSSQIGGGAPNVSEDDASMEMANVAAEAKAAAEL